MSENKTKNDNIQRETSLEVLSGSSANKLPENAFDEIFSRLKTAFGVETDTDLAKSLDLRQGAVSNAKQKRTIPPSWITTVALTKGVSADCLLTGEGEMRRDERNAKIVAAKLRDEHPSQSGLRHMPAYNGKDTLTCFDCELMMVPLVEAKLSAGGGSFETSGDSDRRYAFRMDFLRRKGNASAMVLMRVAGDSMEPKIEHNDVVLIDTSKTELRLGCMYAVAVQDLVYLKMVNAEPGKLILTSANPAYAPLEIDARGDLKNGIRIIGKAVWVGRELD